MQGKNKVMQVLEDIKKKDTSYKQTFSFLLDLIRRFQLERQRE